MIKLKILLVHPVAEKDFFGSSACFLPLGLAYVAAVLEQQVETVKVIDLTVNKMTVEEFGALVRAEVPDVVGFSVVTPTANVAYKLARKAKEECGAKTVAGGPHVTALPDEALQGGMDFVVRGEGEETIVELMEILGSGTSYPDEKLRGVAGLSYRNANGMIVRNPDRPYISNLDKLPFPARHLFPPLTSYVGQPALGTRSPAANLLTSRGCPFGCIFCYKACFGRVFRARSVDSVMAEWHELVDRFGVKEIAIVDDAFATSIPRVMEFCDRLIAEGSKTPWCCPSGLRVDLVTDELMKKMRQAGCYRVAFGVESGNEEILRTIGKRIKLAEVANAVQSARRAGIHTTAFFMLGNPGETRQTMEDTINVAKRVNPDYAQFTVATPYPGTKLYQIASEEGKLLVDNWDDFSFFDARAYYVMGDLTEELVAEMSRRAYREFYLRPSYVLRKLTTASTYRYLGGSVRGAMRFVLGKG